MRLVKFRARELTTRNWVFGQLQCQRKGWNPRSELQYQIVDTEAEYGTEFHKVDESTIGQYVGRKDINEREMYEGDIFTVNGKYPKVILYSEEDMSFVLYNLDDYLIPNPLERECHRQTPDRSWWNDFNREFEVVGNIYESPMLWKEVK